MSDRKERSASDGRFQPGNPGRPAGLPNKVTREWREWHKSLWDDVRARDKLRERVLSEISTPGAEPRWAKLSMEYAFGKPSQQVDLSVTTDPARLLTEAEAELIEREYHASLLPPAAEEND